MLLSRNYWQEREYISVISSTHYCTVRKFQKFSLTFFWQKFRESNGLTKENTKELISRDIFVFPQFAVWKKKNLVSSKQISSNQLYSNFFSKNVIFTKILPKMCDTELQAGNFHTVQWFFRKHLLKSILIRSIY